MSDFNIETVVCAECPTPIQWQQTRAYIVARVSVEVERLHAEAAELRAQLTAGPDKVLRCAFCGFAYPDGTPTHKHDSLAAHVRVCTEHPVGKELRALRADLASAKAEVERVSGERDTLADRVRGLEAVIDKLNEQWTHKHVVKTPLDRAVVDVLLVRYPPAALAPTPPAQQQEKPTP